MIKRVLGTALAAAWMSISAAAAAPAAAASPPPSVEAFGDLPRAQFARLSPDGKHLAIIRPVDGLEKVAFYDLTKADAQPYMVGMDGANAGNVIWKTNEIAIVILHANVVHQHIYHTVYRANRAVSVNVNTHATRLMMYNAAYFKYNYGGGNIIDMDAKDPNYVYMVELDQWDTELMPTVYQVDVNTGVATLVDHGKAKTVDFLTDGNGHLLGRVDQDWDLTDHVYLGANQIMEYPAKGGAPLVIEGLTAGDAPVFVAKRGSSYGTTGLYQLSATGQFGAALYENPNYDVDGAILDERTGRVIGATYTDDLERVKYFDAGLQHVQDTMEKAFPGQSVSILSHDTANTEFVIATDGPKNPPMLYLYTTADHKVNIIEDSYPSLKATDLGEMKPYTYKARDGLDIHAYLTLPPGKPAKNLPVVVFPHGGPEARDHMGFDWWAQYMATRGYAVLQPNFRGSSGYGWGFVAAADGEWANKVQYDVQDGVKKLIDDGIADPKRICIVGASYGGYMALAGATFSPDLYACAVSFAGLSDLDRWLDEGTTFESESASVWRRRIGSDTDSSKTASSSPAKFASQVKIPVLLIHSEKDATVPKKQSEIEADALKSAGKKAELVILPGDDHYLESPAARIDMLKRIDTFLAANIGN